MAAHVPSGQIVVGLALVGWIAIYLVWRIVAITLT